MASVHEVEAALHDLAARLAAVDADLRARHTVDRTVSCTVSDLGVVFVGQLSDDGLTDIRQDGDASAQVRLTAGSDDLIALTQGRLGLPSAWATGRLKVEASVLDLLRLRSWL